MKIEDATKDTEFSKQDTEFFKANPDDFYRIRDLAEGEQEYCLANPESSLEALSWKEALDFIKENAVPSFPIKIMVLVMKLSIRNVAYPVCKPDLSCEDPERDWDICLPIKGKARMFNPDRVALAALATILFSEEMLAGLKPDPEKVN